MKVTVTTIPILIVCITAVALWSTRLYAIPTLRVDYDTVPSTTEDKVEKIEMVVRGVKCTDTAKTASEALTDEPGIIRYVAYASYNRIEISFLPLHISVQEIKELLEGPVYVEESGEFRFNLYRVLEIDGAPVVPYEPDKP